MIVRACDDCKKLNTEVGPLNFVHVTARVEGQFGSKDYLECITISPEIATMQVLRPNRELCNECTGVAVAEALKKRK